MMQSPFDQPLYKTLQQFSHIWFFLKSSLTCIIWRQQNGLVFNNLHWPIEKIRQVIWDTLHDYANIEWKQTLRELEKAPDVAY